MNMDIRPLRTEADYDWALSEIEPYFVSPPLFGTPAAERFDVLTAFIESYEAHYRPIEPSGPVSVIRVQMELSGYSCR
jgi:HTH-type transcriptional regulator/antitoxin HigA